MTDVSVYQDYTMASRKIRLFYFLRFFKNNLVKIELYLSSNISLKRVQKIILNLILIDFFF